MISDTVDTSLAGQDLSGQDLRHRDLAGKVLFGTDLRGADLYAARIALSCETFDGVKLDVLQVAKLLMMIQLADIDPAYQDGLRALVQNVIGERQFRVLERWLRLA